MRNLYILTTYREFLTGIYTTPLCIFLLLFGEYFIPTLNLLIVLYISNICFLRSLHIYYPILLVTPFEFVLTINIGELCALLFTYSMVSLRMYSLQIFMVHTCLMHNTMANLFEYLKFRQRFAILAFFTTKIILSLFMTYIFLSGLNTRYLDNIARAAKKERYCDRYISPYFLFFRKFFDKEINIEKTPIDDDTCEANTLRDFIKRKSRVTKNNSLKKLRKCFSISTFEEEIRKNVELDN